MRELKFRAWDKQYNEMLFVTHINFDTKEIDWSTNLGEPKMMHHFEVMQYTGMRDMKGREIFESDLLQITDPYTNKAAKGVARVVFSNEYVGGWVAAVDYEQKLNIGTRRKWVEVVGNIYENPELLNVK